MRFQSRLLFLAAALAASAPLAAQAHFQELLPSTDIVPDEGDRTVNLSIVFTHPVERGPTMNMGEPIQFGVLADGKKTDLKSSLKLTPFDGKTAYSAQYKVQKPGDYVFFLEPAPYWEPAESQYIQHFTKVVVDFGSGEGWDKLVGLPIEIEPLARPYGLWTGNLFRGRVLKDGQPLPFGDVEVEWTNDGSVKPPADAFNTQVIKTDAQGEFAYAMPRAAWWAFNALTEGPQRKSPDGRMVGTEIGGTMWVHTVDMNPPAAAAAAKP
jgi:cobalt/nickel transport protein